MITTRRAMLALAPLALALTSLAAPPAGAEVSEVRLAQQFGIGYLPLTVMREHKLLEKHAEKAGLKVTTAWNRFSSGAAMNEALISGNLEFASGGVGPLVVIWARTKGNLNVKGVAAINSMPLYLTTNNPKVTSLRDFADSDRIALPAVKVSIQAVTLQMAAEKVFGEGKHDTLDRLTVSMSHPDATAALLSGRSEITANFSSPPFMFQQLADQRVKRVLSSYDVLGGPSTFNTIWTTSAFRDANPKTYKAFVAALDEAMAWIKADTRRAAALYVDAEKSKLALDFIEQMVANPEISFTTAPRNVMKYADFMHRIGSIKTRPADWKELFFEEIHGVPGS